MGHLVDEGGTRHAVRFDGRSPLVSAANMVQPVESMEDPPQPFEVNALHLPDISCRLLLLFLSLSPSLSLSLSLSLHLRHKIALVEV